MKHHKRIVLDFDDTLAFPVNRDFKNAKPNNALIHKVNELYEQGWQIDIFTARGSISCKTREEAKEKYQREIIDWLDKHRVKYHNLSFDKPLAAYYVDDKGISPEDFIKTKIKNLEGGLSGSDIYTDGKLVHKTDPNAHDVNEWFNIAKRLYIKVPHVERVVGETMTMEYIEHDKNFFIRHPYRALSYIQECLEKFKKATYEDENSFIDYSERIRSHIKACDIHQDMLWDLVFNELKQIEWPKESFGHGDFGITNMLFNKNSITLIDPIPNVFTCVELDVAKFIASLYVNKYDKEIISLSKRALCCYNCLDEKDINVLVRCELTRIIKYHPNKEYIIELIQNVY
jgi:capsule biosynthesis phosphatase